MIVVTGGAGLIGSNIIRELNNRKIDNIIIVDHLGTNHKWKNLVDLRYNRFIEKANFLDELKRLEGVRCIFHMGACSNTVEKNASYLIENNFNYTRQLAEYCLEKECKFIYASSAATYGDGTNGYDDNESEINKLRPLNMYGYSKQLFDQWVIQNAYQTKFVGLKYFNVYGPYEFHKENMQSLILKAFYQIKEEGKIRLFKSYKEDYKNGEQKRDFIYVKNAVNMTLHFMDKRNIAGIYNIGSGKASSWNELAEAIFMAMKKPVNIEYVDMPLNLKKQYQYFTQANMEKFFKLDFDQKILLNLNNSVRDYIQFLNSKQIYNFF